MGELIGLSRITEDFKIDNVRIYDMPEAVVASGYPKATTLEGRKFKQADMERAGKLGHAPHSSGHDCFAKGIVVKFDLTASHAFWIQWLRYHFNDIDSSQSKMHRIMQMDIAKQCNRYVDQRIIDIFNEKKAVIEAEGYTEERFFDLVYNVPMGYTLGARVSENYLSLKTEYYQRKTDKLYEWHEYCAWIETLPFVNKLILK